MKINEFFENAYYLNLDRRPDRKSDFEKEMRKYQLEKFVNRRVSIDANLHMNEIYRNMGWFRQHFCSLSFYKIFREAYHKNYKSVAVFEDDFTIVNSNYTNGIRNIEKALDQLSIIENWDIIYFGGYIFDKEIQKVSANLLKANTVLTLHGVGISRSGLTKLLNFQPFIDSAFDGWIGQRKYINKYVVYPMSSHQRNCASDLDDSKKTPDLNHWKNHFIQGKLINL
jgi:hypothetical protein